MSNPFEVDPHYLMGPTDVYAHLVKHHAHQADIDVMVDAVTAEQLTEYRSRVVTENIDSEDKHEVVHELLHERFGEDHTNHGAH